MDGLDDTVVDAIPWTLSRVTPSDICECNTFSRSQEICSQDRALNNKDVHIKMSCVTPSLVSAVSYHMLQ